MKKITTKILMSVACVTMMFASMADTQSVQAAVKVQGTIDLQKKVLIIPKGKKTAIRQNNITLVKGCRYRVRARSGKVKLESTDPSIVPVYRKIIMAQMPGSSTLRITYKGKTQSLKIKVIASHKHSFKTTKKATCKRKGVKTCTDCGLTNTLPKTAHHYMTETCTSIEGRGKKITDVYTVMCSGCDWDMTNWTSDQRYAHQSHFEAVEAGKLNFCGLGYYGVAGIVRYEKYVKVLTTETCCKNCGAWDMDRTYDTDLYYVDTKMHNKISADEDPWEVWSYETYCKEYGFLLCEGCHLEVMPGYECHRCHIVAPNTPVANTTAQKRGY